MNPSSREIIKNLSDEARKELGIHLFHLQLGLKVGMPFSRPMPILGSGCHEMRFKDSYGIYRAFYYLKLEEKILVFHVFGKKTQKTPDHEIEIGKKKLKEML